MSVPDKILAAVAQLEEGIFYPLECYLKAKTGEAYWVNSVDDLGLVVVPVGLGEDADVNTRGIDFEQIEETDLELLLTQILTGQGSTTQL